MRLPRLYLPAPLAIDAEVDLDERCHRHAVQVLRLKPGARLVLFNGDGHDYAAELTRCEKRHSAVRILDAAINRSESPLGVTLAQGIAKSDHMDYSLQKAVELGVAAIAPILTERSVLQLDARRLDKKRDHWRGVIVSACEQSGRSRIPELQPIQTLDEWLAGFQGYGLVLDPRARETLAALPSPGDRCTALVGPEGGLTERELDKAHSAGFNAIRMGPRILRTETAASAILTSVQLLWGDFNLTPGA